MTKKAKLSKNTYQYKGLNPKYPKTFKRMPIKGIEAKVEEKKK